MERDRDFRVSKVSPSPLSAETRDKKVLEAIKALQEVEKSYQGSREALINVGNEPIWLIEAGDLHVGSLASDHKALLGLRDMVLSRPNTGLVLLGDEIEGLKAQYLSTNTARTPIDVNVQIDFLRDTFLKPLVKKNKILAMVSGYFGHPGWSEDATTINTWIMMTKGLNIPILLNGGTLRIKFANGHEHLKQIFHYPQGNSKFDSAFGLRNVAYSSSEGGGRAHGYSKGHHHTAGIAKENYPRATISPYYISSGTLKGSSLSLPLDRLGAKIGAPPTDPIGQGVNIMPRRVGKNYERYYPTISFKHGEILHTATQILDRTEQQSITDEVMGKILHMAPQPTINFVDKKSNTTRKPYDEMPSNSKENGYKRSDLAPQYDSVFYNVESQLPVAVHFLANVRLGSSYDGYSTLRSFMSNYIEKNPYAVAVFMRNLIDSGVATEVYREEVLEKYVRLLKLPGDRSLAFMLDESLRKDPWKKDKKKGKRKAVGIPAATWLSEKSGVRIIHHMSDISLAVGPSKDFRSKPVYKGVYTDKLFQHGSFSRPTYGLRRVYDLYLASKPGYVVGGHMPVSGISSIHDRDNPETKYPFFVGTGWWAAYVDSAGQGNVSPGAAPGQGIVLLPGSSSKEYTAFPFSNPDEADYIPRALTLLTGLNLLKISPKKIIGY